MSALLTSLAIIKSAPLRSLFCLACSITLLVSAANEYVDSKNLHYEVRFDIVSIVLQKETAKIEHLKNGFLHF